MGECGAFSAWNASYHQDATDQKPPVRYRVVVSDRKTGEPIEAGRGQVFATSSDGVDVYDPLVKGEELGTYYATMRFITAGEWAIAIRFPRDSTKPLERWTGCRKSLPNAEDSNRIMRHFHRTHLTPAECLETADAFFAALGLKTTASAPRMRTYQGRVKE